MPIFDYQCNDCSEEFEFFLLRSYDSPVCPACSGVNLSKKTSSFKVGKGGSSGEESFASSVEQATEQGHVCTSACNHGSKPHSHGQMSLPKLDVQEPMLILFGKNTVTSFSLLKAVPIERVLLSIFP